MFSMDEVCVLTIDVENVLQHAQNKRGDGKDLRERTEADLLGDGNEQ